MIEEEDFLVWVYGVGFKGWIDYFFIVRDVDGVVVI